MIERYTLPEMGAIWSQQNKFQKWLDVEIAVCEVHAEDGTIPREAVDEIKAKAAFGIRNLGVGEPRADQVIIGRDVGIRHRGYKGNDLFPFDLVKQGRD